MRKRGVTFTAMLAVSPSASRFSIVLANELATRKLAVDVAAILKGGDLITLSGDLGAGKTAFARALIRHLANDDTLDVPSPTFTLVQSYALPRFPVVHADLYRVAQTSELTELGVDEAAEDAVVLLEWPDRAGDALPPDRLDIAFTLAPHLGVNQRNAELTAHGTFVPRLERLSAIRHFLAAEGLSDATRMHLQGDASTRAYERITHEGRSLILMNAPRRADGPPVRGGMPYSAIAHLAEDVKPFVAMARGLRERGLSAPLVHAADLKEGLLLLEDLGSETVVAGDPPGPIEERYAAAVDVLVELHRAAGRRHASRGAECRSSPAALRHRGVPDRGGTADRLVSAASRQVGQQRGPLRIRRLVARGARARL